MLFHCRHGKAYLFAKVYQVQMELITGSVLKFKLEAVTLMMSDWLLAAEVKSQLYSGFRVFAVFGEEGGLIDKKNSWSSIFEVEDPRSKFPQCTGKFLDAYQALEVVRFDIQYCDWRSRQDLLTIMLLHEKAVGVRFGRRVSAVVWLSPRVQVHRHGKKGARRGLQNELAQAHKQVHISEARVSAALDKLAYMEELVSDRLLQDRSVVESDKSSAPSTSSSTESSDKVKINTSRKGLNGISSIYFYVYDCNIHIAVLLSVLLLLEKNVQVLT
ncbi:hypothetical protein QQ045_020907 [Rhodiola kirilowii]